MQFRERFRDYPYFFNTLQIQLMIIFIRYLPKPNLKYLFTKTHVICISYDIKHMCGITLCSSIWTEGIKDSEINQAPPLLCFFCAQVRCWFQNHTFSGNKNAHKALLKPLCSVMDTKTHIVDEKVREQARPVEKAVVELSECLHIGTSRIAGLG